MKNDNFFKHDASACNGEKMMNLIDKEGLRGYGAYWVLLEALRKETDFCCPLSILQSLAIRSRVRASYLLHIVQDFGLFVVEKDHFYSPGMKRRMSTYLLSSKLESVKKRPKVLEMSESSAVPARITEKNRTEKNITVVDSNIGGGQIPLKPIVGWEALVNEMALCEDYMNQAGVHSGLGGLYLRCRKRIVGLFKTHIQLQGKQENLLTLGDVKSYFTNFIAAGTVTNRKVREALQREKLEEERFDFHRFETVVDGQRSYLGHLIPNDAPPRPDPSSVWDNLLKQWHH